MNKSVIDAGIPVLTEIIEPPPQTINEERDSAPAAPVAVAIPPPADEIAATGLSAADRLIDVDWAELERQISERVLQQMLGRIDSVLEQKIRDSLADVLQLAVEGLANDIKGGLQQTLEEVISRAVAQEISHLQSSKKQTFR